MFFKNKKIVFLTKTNWDYYLHPYRTLYARELSKYADTVYWVNEPTRNPFKFFKKNFKNKSISKSIKIFTPLLPTCTNENLSKTNALLLRIQIYFLAGKLDRSTVIWSVYCSHLNVVLHYPAAFKIYWLGDLFDPVKEALSLKVYDLVMPLTEDIFEHIKKIFPNKAFLSTTGCDEDLFSICRVKKKDFIPKELQFVNDLKILGYVGNISSFRLDFELIEKLVKEFQNIRFVLVGISDQKHETKEFLSKLKKFDNFHLIENIEYSQIPFYIYHFQAGFIPYKLNKFNSGTNPNKFYEYCSMGKVTFSSRIPSLIKYHPSIILSQTTEEWVENIYKYIANIADSENLISISIEASPKKSINRISDYLLKNNYSQK